MVTEDLLLENSILFRNEATGQAAEQAQEIRLKTSTSGDRNELKREASDEDGATSNGKRRLDTDALEVQPEKRLKSENAANATLQSAGEPGTTEDGHKQRPTGSDEDSCLLEVSDDEQDAHDLVRVISDEQAAADLEAIRGMWELAAVYEFMSQFKHWLNFSQLYPVQDLEEAIVRSPGPGILAQLHVDLLKGICTRSHVGLENWVSTLSARLLSEANAMQQPLKRLPFRPVRGKEAAGYAQLGAVERVLTLKALADMRADREDMRLMVDDIMAGEKLASSATPPPNARRSARGAAPAPPALTPEDLRGRQPLGVDGAGCAYYWFDMPYDHDAPVGLMCSRLYVEGPPQQPSQQQLEQLLQEQQDNEKRDREQDAAAVTADKPPLPPLRSSGGGASKPNGPAAADQHVAASVANSRQGSPEPARCKNQQHKQQHGADREKAAETKPVSTIEPVLTATNGNDSSCAAVLKAEAVQAVPATVARVEEPAAADENREPAGTAGEAKVSAPGKSKLQQGAADVKPDAPAAHAGDKLTASKLPVAEPQNQEQDAAAEEPTAVNVGKTVLGDGAADAKHSKHRSKGSKATFRNEQDVNAQPARPGRKAAAEASAKMAQQLMPGSSRPAEPAQDTRANPGGKRKRDSGSKGKTAAVVSATAAEGDEPIKGRKAQASPEQQQTEADAALAAELAAAAAGRGRPTRRAAADASAKIAAQSRDPPIHKLAEEASKATPVKPAKQKGARDSGRDKPKQADSSSKHPVAAEKQQRLPSANYVLPPDHVAGSWRVVSDSVDALEVLAAKLVERGTPADVALGKLLQEQVVATLLERKEREEKYARARSRVARSLGLDTVAVDAGRSRRERKSVKYDYDEFDVKMKTAIRAQQKGELEIEDFYAIQRNPAAAPEYDVQVRKGRSGGAAEPVMTLEEIEAMRKKKIEIQKLRAAGLLPPEEEERLQQEEQLRQRQREEEERAHAAQQHKDRQKGVSDQVQENQPTSKQQQAADKQAADAVSQAAAANSSKGSRKRSLPPGSAPAPKPQQQRKQPPAAKPKAPVAPPAPSAWQLAAAAAAAAAADSGAAGSGRPKRRAAAGVHAAIAAAAAAAGGREEDFLGMAAHMQDEYESHIGADHVGRGYGADGLPPRGHFYSTSTHSVTALPQQAAAQPSASSLPAAQTQQQQAPAPVAAPADHNHSRVTEAACPTEVHMQQALPVASAVSQHTAHPIQPGAAADLMQAPAQARCAAPEAAADSAVAVIADTSRGAGAIQAPTANHAGGDVRLQPHSAVESTSTPDIAAALAAAAAAAGDVSLRQQLQQLPAVRQVPEHNMLSPHTLDHHQHIDYLQQQPPINNWATTHQAAKPDVNAYPEQQQQLELQHVLPILQGVPISRVEQAPNHQWQEQQQQQQPNQAPAVSLQQQQQQQFDSGPGYPPQQLNAPPAQQPWLT